MHSLSVKSDLLISASILDCLFWSIASLALSLPAKSIKANFPHTFSLESLKYICNMACYLEESTLLEVELVVLSLIPNEITFIRSSTISTLFPDNATILMFGLVSLQIRYSYYFIEQIK